MFAGSILCRLTEALLSLLRPLKFVHHERHHASCRCECSAQNGRAELTHDDVVVAMRALGLMATWRGNGECDGCCLLQEAQAFLEDKMASFEELNEAFTVFDRDGDGFISASELQSVMGRLGLEGSVSEDCEKMIRAFDRDGDGRISLDEFQVMMQGAV